MILALQNDVFKAMFYGNFPTEDRVVITDLHPDGVFGLLRYFYSGQVQVKTAQHAAYVRTAADKYLVPDLAQKCVDYVRRNMKPEYVCPFLDYILTMGEEDVDGAAKNAIHNHSWEVLSSEAFKFSHVDTVSYILDYVTNVPQASVLATVHAWAQQQRLCLDASQERADLRAVMLPLFPKLHFLSLTATEFVEGPNAWGILTSDEALAIMTNIAKEGSMPLPHGFSKVRTRGVQASQTATATFNKRAYSGPSHASSGFDHSREVSTPASQMNGSFSGFGFGPNNSTSTNWSSPHIAPSGVDHRRDVSHPVSQMNKNFVGFSFGLNNGTSTNRSPPRIASSGVDHRREVSTPISGTNSIFGGFRQNTSTAMDRLPPNVLGLKTTDEAIQWYNMVRYFGSGESWMDFL
ncbi:BTB/POZ domain-containing protein 6-A-like [Amblyomma americanum]